MSEVTDEFLRVDVSEAGYLPLSAPVVTDASFRVEPGGALLLIGRNGSGKSTLLRGLAGDPQVYVKGTVVYRDEPARLDPRWWQDRGVLWIPQHGGAFEELSVRENLDFFARRAGALSLDPALGMFPDLSPLLRRKAMHLSGGERRMVELSPVAFCSAPAILIVDEPTAPLSSQNTDRFMRHVNRLMDSGTAVLIATHKDEFSSRRHEVMRLGES